MKRDLIFILIGIVVCLGSIATYNKLRPKQIYSESGNIRLVSLNESISRQRTNAIVLAANRVGPSVVSITVIQTRIISTSPLFSPFSDEFFREFFKDFFPERQYRQQIKSLGSGVIISKDGYIITNEHVVSNATEIRITLSDGRDFKGEIIASDRRADVALLKIEGNNLPYAELGDSDSLLIGEWVIALGNPFAFLLEDTRPTVTVGVVSALNRSIRSKHKERLYKNMVQTDAAINPGNSGGPLVNILGSVVGINTFIFTAGGGSEGIGFARPINVVKKFINEVKKFGRLREPWIGIWLQDDKAGVLVSALDKNGPAAKAGISKGDQIKNVNGKPINFVTDWKRYTASVFVDDTLKIKLNRKGNLIETNLLVEELAEGIPTNLGIWVKDITPTLSKKYGLGYTQGVVAVKVEQNSVGERSGILPGDVILRVGEKRIKNKNDFIVSVRKLKDSYLIISRGGLIIQVYL